MALSNDHFIIDSIHGDIHPTDQEKRVIDTPTFQRLRYIKQLQMGHLTYPNATHTRFMHSLGTLSNTIRFLNIEGVKVSKAKQANLRLAALLHDIGHYPYSHLMEKVDKVTLMEEFVYAGKKKQTYVADFYPDHEKLGKTIILENPDIANAIGDIKQSEAIAGIIGKEDFKLSGLITSSLDLDRIDYLIRDSHSIGLPYGHIDRNYIFNSLRMKQGVMGVGEKAVPAVEHFLLSRYFMYRTVYYHRTTVAFEEACRQLIRRLRDAGKYDVPKDGNEICDIVRDKDRLSKFNDSLVDSWIRDAAKEKNGVIKYLAQSILSRNAPKLLKEVLVLVSKTELCHRGSFFKNKCRDRIRDLAKRYSVQIGQFMWCEFCIDFEKEPSRYTVTQVASMRKEKSSKLKEEEKREKEVVKIFEDKSGKPVSISEISYSVLKELSKHMFIISRLYLVPAGLSDAEIKQIREDIKDWDDPV
jgi:uncharacterized protein